MLFAAVATVWPQGREIPEAEYGAIPDSLLSMDEYGKFPSAPYFYAFKGLSVTFEEDDRSIIANLEYHVRIKVFDSDAREASLIALPYYFDNEIEQIDKIKGVTYTPDGRKFPLSGDAVRTININSRYNVKEFTMPNVTDGSVIEYVYLKKRRYIEELPDFYLTHQAPTAIAKVTIRYPRYLRYSIVPSDFNGDLRRIEVREDTSSVPKVFTVPQPEPLVKEHWVAYNVPPVETETYISSIDDYRGKLKFQLDEFGLPRQKLENSWDLVVARIRKEQNPWNEVKKNDFARKTGREIARELNSKEAIQDSIYRFVNERAKFNGAKRSFSGTTDKEVLEEQQPADQAAVNQTLIAMLEGAGINAYPLLISTRQFGQVNRSFPSLFQFNGLLVYSEIDGTHYYMDASFPHSYPNLIPVDTYNETGLLLRRDSYEWIEIKPDKSIFSIRIEVDGSLDSLGTLRGNVNAQYTGYSGRLIREKASGGETVGDIIRGALFDGYREVSFSSAEIDHIENYSKPVHMEADFMIEDYAESFRDALDFRPMVMGYLMSNPFDERRRELPVTLDAPEQLDLFYTIDLPPGTAMNKGTSNQVTELPGARLAEKYDLTNETLVYEFHIDIARKSFEQDLYPQLLDLYERWVELSSMNWQIKRN